MGDSLSNLLLVAAILKRHQRTAEAWAAMYKPLACQLAAVRVADRHAMTTTCMETRVERPAALQDAIDAAVATVDGGRAFVRPSGTEDVVRVYAEATSTAACEALSSSVVALVRAHAGGSVP